jgi:hypothetical protein
MNRAATGLVVALLACSDSSGPPASASAYFGEWTVVADARAGCWEGPIQIRFDLTPANVTESATLLEATGDWWLPDTQLRWFQGRIHWDTSRFQFLLHPGADVVADGPSPLDFSGTDVTEDRLQGLLTDSDGILNNTPGCTVRAVATKH